MKKRIFTTVLLFFGISITVIGQSNFKEGYIITNTNDTIRGFVDSRGEYLNSTVCSFKKNLDEKPVSYAPGRIKAYRIKDGKFYISAHVETLDKDVFLEYLIDGVVDIFYYKETVNEYYFINKDDNRYHLLDNRKIEKIIDGREYTTNSKKYIGLLNLYLDDSEQAKRKINTVRIDHRSLIKLAKDYNDDVCTTGEECIVFEKKIRAFKFNFSGLLYLNYSSLDFGGTNFNFLKGLDAMSDYSYELGAGVSMQAPRLNERLFLYLQFLYGSNTFKDSYSYLHGDFPSIYKFKQDYTYFDRTLGVKYKYPVGYLKPELLIGYSSTIFFISDDGYAIRETTMPDGTIDIGNFTEDNSYLLNNAIVLGLGFNIYSLEKVEIRFNVQYKYGYDIEPSNPKMRTVRAGLNIQF